MTDTLTLGRIELRAVRDIHGPRALLTTDSGPMQSDIFWPVTTLGPEDITKLRDWCNAFLEPKEARGAAGRFVTRSEFVERWRERGEDPREHETPPYEEPCEEEEEDQCPTE